MNPTPQRFQIVVCTGPRCLARGQVTKHVARLEGRIVEFKHTERVGVAYYECLSRCPAGPNVVVRSLTEGEDINRQPGMLDLDGACHYHSVTTSQLDCIVDAHSEGHPVAGRYLRY